MATRMPGSRPDGELSPSSTITAAASCPWIRGIERRRILDRADVTEEVVEVGAAEADRLRSKEHLAGAG